jgi:hypothetical protein
LLTPLVRLYRTLLQMSLLQMFLPRQQLLQQLLLRSQLLWVQQLLLCCCTVAMRSQERPGGSCGCGSCYPSLPYATFGIDCS